MQSRVRLVPNLHEGKVKMSHMNHTADDEDTWLWMLRREEKWLRVKSLILW